MARETQTVAAQRQFLVKVDGIEGYFASKTGGEMAGDVSRVYDGGKLTPEVLGSPAMPGDIVVGRPFKPARDASLLARLMPKVNRWRTTLSIQATDADLIPIGRPLVYANALLTRVAPPEHDAGSGEAARLELTFATETVR